MGEPDKNLPLPRRLADLAERLNALRYHARWEAGALGPRIVFGHCPYGEIIARHPELCIMDALMLSKEMDATAEQLSKIDRTSGTATQCLFSLRLHGPGSVP